MNDPKECCRSSSIGVTCCETPLAGPHLHHPVQTNCGVGLTVGHEPVACSRRANANDLDINDALDCALDFYQSEMCVVDSLTAVVFFYLVSAPKRCAFFTHTTSRSQGIVDGAKAAEASNVSVATVMGVQRGGTVGIELGFYRGIAAAWAAKGLMYVC